MSYLNLGCTQDNAITLGFQRQMQGWTPNIQKVYTLESDHSPFLSHPQELGQILLELA